MPVLSYEPPRRNVPPSEGRSFHCLHATSHALQPMQTLVSVKKPIRFAPGSMIESSLMLVDLRGMVLVGGDAGRRVADAGERTRIHRRAAGAHVADEGLGLVDARVGIAGEHDQVIGGVAGVRAAEAP